MERRKIQLVAGSTYSLSLPKSWVLKNKLKEKTPVIVHEKEDGSLAILKEYENIKELKEITLNIDEYSENIGQVLFAVYYLGFENIVLISQKKLNKEIKSKIRSALTDMSGTEIIFEDSEKIKIKVLLDKSKVDIVQIFYRISLLIDSSLSNISGRIDKNEMQINEDEIDRLYNLMVKIVQLSLIDSNILHSSKINNISLVPSYFLIAKKLENIADNIFHLSKYLRKKKKSFENKTEIIEFFRKELDRSVKFIITPLKNFKKINQYVSEDIGMLILKIKDEGALSYVKDIQRYILDIEDEILNISFYNHLINEKIL